MPGSSSVGTKKNSWDDSLGTTSRLQEQRRVADELLLSAFRRSMSSTDSEREIKVRPVSNYTREPVPTPFIEAKGVSYAAIKAPKPA